MSLERQQDQNINPEQYSIVRRDQSGLTIPESVREAGFSSTFGTSLKRLNDVLAGIEPPRTIGFNLEILPDAQNPNVDFMAVRTRPFKIELMSENIHVPYISELAIRVTELQHVDAYLGLSDLREFTSRAFPNKRPTVYIEPRGPIVDRFKQEALYMRDWKRVADSLYTEETDKEFHSAARRNRSLVEEALSKEGILVIEDDLCAITEEDLATLVAMAHEYRWPEIRIEGQRDSVLNLFIPNFGDNTDFNIEKLYFRGKPQEVEQVIEQFSLLMEKAHKLSDRKEKQKVVNVDDIQGSKQSLALPEGNKLTIEQLLRRRGKE